MFVTIRLIVNNNYTSGRIILNGNVSDVVTSASSHNTSGHTVVTSASNAPVTSSLATGTWCAVHLVLYLQVRYRSC